MTSSRPTVFLLSCVALRGLLSPAASAQPVEEEVRRQVELLREHGEIMVGGARIVSTQELTALYERRGFAPIWTDPEKRAELLSAILDAEGDGLDPRDYHLDALVAESGEGPLGPSITAGGDLLRTDALWRLAGDLRFGKVGPSARDLGRAVPAPVPGSDRVALLEALVGPAEVGAALEALRPDHSIYSGLRRALAEHRALHERGGWPDLGTGRALRLADIDPEVPALRRRLSLAGDLAPAAEPSLEVFDADLDRALRRFQHRHGLNEDGVLGPATRAALAVPVEARIDQIRANLERARWILRDLAPSFVAVNVAGQKLYVVRDGTVIWETRVVVGKTATRTPVFAATLRYVVLNPAWDVPRSIAPEILAVARRDPSYLRRQGFEVLDSAGRQVDPGALDPSAFETVPFPYRLRQQPGPQNALGRIKLVFPNDHSVYLHDTPGRSLFERDLRTFSHGCIRVQDVVRLGELVLDDPGRFSRGALEAAIGSGATATLLLARPLPVLVLYWTAATDHHGELHFYRDVYGRDPALLRALAAP